MGDLEALKNALKVNLESQYAGATRMKVKRALLDQLDTAHDFQLPPRMVESEFQGIWNQVEASRRRGANWPPEDARASPRTSSRPSTARSPNAACDLA